MWLKYQQVSSKMASFDPREIGKTTNDVETIKHPLKRFEPTLRTSLKVVIPMNLDRLKKHKVNVEKYMRGKQWKELNMETINSTRTVQQLQATIRDLDKIRYQLQEEDIGKFDVQITGMKVEARKAVEDFNSVQELISAQTHPLHPLYSDKKNDDALDCYIDRRRNSDDTLPLLESETDSSLKQRNSHLKSSAESSDALPVGGLQEHQLVDGPTTNEEEIAAYQSWDHLKNGLVDLDTLVKDFAACVQEQQETVDNIEDNIDSAHQNVSSAATILGQANKYKAAIVPIAGAIIGGLIAGPIGMITGFKVAGAAAAIGGGVAGYQGGKYIKKRHDKNVELELTHLSRPEKN